MKTLAAVLASVLLAACATVPTDHRADRFFNDRMFAAATARIDVRDIFALSPDMRRYLEANVEGPMKSKGRQRALVDALYTSGELKLQYDTETTRNAAEAFAAGAGNCQSLVIVAAALAWMHFAIRRMEHRQFPEIRRETVLPELLDATRER